MRNILIILLPLVTIFILNCSSIKNDLNFICTTATKITEKSTVKKEMQVLELGLKLKNANLSDKMKIFLKKLGTGKDGGYAKMVTFAKRNGHPNWRCNPLKDILSRIPEKLKKNK